MLIILWLRKEDSKMLLCDRDKTSDCDLPNLTRFYLNCCALIIYDIKDYKRWASFNQESFIVSCNAGHTRTICRSPNSAVLLHKLASLLLLKGFPKIRLMPL